MSRRILYVHNSSTNRGRCGCGTNVVGMNGISTEESPLAERNALVFDPHLCTGCMYCMTACSTHNERATSLSEARLRVIRHEGHALTGISDEDELVFKLVVCRQCEEPACAAACHADAITRRSATGAVLIRQGACTGCGECAKACPFGAIAARERKEGWPRFFKCDLCGGEPQCVKFCYAGALKYIPVEEAGTRQGFMANGKGMIPPPKKSKAAKRGNRQ